LFPNGGYGPNGGNGPKLLFPNDGYGTKGLNGAFYGQDTLLPKLSTQTCIVNGPSI